MTRATRRRVRSLGIALFLIALAALALARPGGGDSYSGSSGSGSDGGGGASDLAGLLIYLLIELVTEVPEIGIPLLLLVAVGYGVMVAYGRVSRAWNNRAAEDMLEAGRRHDEWLASTGRAPARATLEQIRDIDPEFSRVVFEDFFYSLYAEAHRARGAGTLDLLAPYLGPTARRTLAALPGRAVRAVVVGAMRCTAVHIPVDGDARVEVTLELEANYTQEEGGGARTYYVVERWNVSRSRSARSRPPKRARTIDCPSCGAPLSKVVGGTCEYCHTVVSNGELDWLVDSIQVIREERRPPALTTDVEEVGTSSPTVVEPEARARFDALVERDPEMGMDALQERVKVVFDTLQTAWSEQELRIARPYLSDRLYETFEYWMEAYHAAGLRNVTEQARILRIVLARVVSDRHYDSVTLRVYAQSLDYTLDESGKVVTGSRSKPRLYSEYWTLIRGATVRGAPRTDAKCPSCGAPFDVAAMTGTCNHCQAKVTSGDFDWVLSRIEQDESV